VAQDELLWAAAWLYQASGDRRYLDYLANNADALGGTGWSINQFGWDVKYPGVQVLAAMVLLRGKAGGGAHADVLRRYKQKADLFACSCLGRAGASNVRRTPGGMIYHQSWNNVQFVTSVSFLLAAYGDHLAAARQAAQCPSGAAAAQPAELLAFARSQVDYILGSNPRATSYMVGYGATYPLQAHHRGASIVSIKADPAFVSCQGGYSSWYHRRGSNPNLLVGATVGGPDEYDNFADERDNYEQTEATTYNNAPMMGVLARLAAGHAGGRRFGHSLADGSLLARRYFSADHHAAMWAFLVSYQFGFLCLQRYLHHPSRATTRPHGHLHLWVTNLTISQHFLLVDRSMH